MSAETRVEAEFEEPPVLVPLDDRPRTRVLRLGHLLYIVLYSALVCWVGVMTGWLLLALLFGVAFALIFGGVVIYGRRRSIQQDALLWALAIAADRGMPLEATFEAFAGQCRGRYRRTVLAAAAELRRGASIPEVLQDHPGLFPRSAEILIRMGIASGVPAAAFRESSLLRSSTRPAWAAFAGRLAYLMWILIVLQSIVSFIFYFIMPKFEAIFADFGASLPSVMILTIEATHFCTRYWPITILAGFVELAIVTLAMVSIVGVLPWDLGFVGSFFSSHHSSLVLRCLARVVEGRKSLVKAMAVLAKEYPRRATRRRLGEAARDVEQGMHWCDALEHRGVIRPSEATLLEAAERAGNLAWALRVAAENRDRRFVYQLQLLGQWLFPLMVLAVGGIVFMVVVSYFYPLIILIQRLT